MIEEYEDVARVAGSVLIGAATGSEFPLSEESSRGDDAAEVAGKFVVTAAPPVGAAPAFVRTGLPKSGSGSPAALEEIAARDGSILGPAGIVETLSANVFGIFASAAGTEIAGAANGMFDASDGALLVCRPCEIGDFAATECPALEKIAFESCDETDVGEGQAGIVGAGRVATFAVVGAELGWNS